MENLVLTGMAIPPLPIESPDRTQLIAPSVDQKDLVGCASGFGGDAKQRHGKFTPRLQDPQSLGGGHDACQCQYQSRVA